MARAVDPHSFCGSGSSCSSKCGSGSSLKIICNKLPYVWTWKTKKIAEKLKTMELVQIYVILFNTITIITSFLSFFVFFPSNLYLLDPDPHIECGSKSRRKNECGSMRIRIHSTDFGSSTFLPGGPRTGCFSVGPDGLLVNFFFDKNHIVFHAVWKTSGRAGRSHILSNLKHQSNVITVLRRSWFRIISWLNFAGIYN